MFPLDERFRSQYHYSPRANWLNDPNGLVYYWGKYHLFYQYHPGSSSWGPMHWGHATSRDLVNWHELAIALYPDENGMIFSGSAVIDWQNTAGFGKEAMVVIFTHDQNGYESQSLAYSTDEGLTWVKYPGNPVLRPPANLHDFRDPKVFWYNQNGSGYWIMSLAAENQILFYQSADLIHWQPCGSFGAGFGSNLGVWETPDLFQLPVEDSLEKRWVLLVGVGDGSPAGKSGQQYFIGHFDGKTFYSENSAEQILWADFGADFYAAQTWSDAPNERRLAVGWLGNWQYATVVPTTNFRGVFSLPRELSLKQTAKGIRLAQEPISELARLRTAHSRWSDVTISAETNLIEDLRGELFEINAEFQLNPRTESFGLRVRVGLGEHTTIRYEAKGQKLFFDRTRSGLSNFEGGFAGIHATDLAPANGILRLKIFVDRASVEVFANDGLVVFSECIYPAEDSQGLEIFTESGEILVHSLDIYKLTPAVFTVFDSSGVPSNSAQALLVDSRSNSE